MNLRDSKGVREGFHHGFEMGSKRDLRGIQGEDEKGFFSNSLLGKG